ncbi:hypothetical protein DZC34_06770 [Clostridium botulinum]|nr:hypothetical protein DZC34_06770 [Clostridium botulinum]
MKGKKEKDKTKTKQAKEEKMLIENEIAYVLGELSMLSKGTQEYENMKRKFQELISKKKYLNIL